MNRQISKRNLYYANRVMAKEQPYEFLYIIHDKMDQAKIGIPKTMEMLKKLSTNYSPLSLALTRILTHGREPGYYAYFSITRF